MKYKNLFVCLFIMLFFFSGTNCMSPSGHTVMVMENINAIWLNRWYVSEAIHRLHGEHTRDQLVLIRYYVDSTEDHPFPRLSCKEAEERMKWYMTSDHGIPMTFFNGTEYIKGSIPNPDDDTMEGRIKAYKEFCEKKMTEVNARVPPITIWASCKKSEAENEYTLDVSVKAKATLSYSSLMLNIALVESNIPYSAINGEVMHFQVFREWIKPPEIKDTIGIPLNLSRFGDLFQKQFAFHLDTELYKKDLSIILFVQDGETKTILQGLEIEPT